MYDFAGVELPKDGTAYIVRNGEIVYLQLLNIVDNNILSSGNTVTNGELEVNIHYSAGSITRDALFLQVFVQNGNTELVAWVVGDFDADGRYTPGNSIDTPIQCDTTGVVMYGQVRSAGFKDYAIASSSAPDIVGYCGSSSNDGTGTGSTGSGSTVDGSTGSGSTGSGSDTGSTGGTGSDGSGSTGSGSTGSGSGSGSSDGSTGSGSTGDGSGSTGSNGDGTGSDGERYCTSDIIKGHVKIKNEEYVEFKSCEIRGKMDIKNSHVGSIYSIHKGKIKTEKNSFLKIERGKMYGKLYLKDSEAEVTDSTIKGNVKAKESDLMMEGTEIRGDVHVKGGSLTLIDVVIHGNLKCDKDVQYSFTDIIVNGKVEEHCSEGDDDHDDEHDEDDEDDD
jgi:hypothetical protein